jgi:glycosyltransferase involved in cell wall biosynthesis
MALSDIHPVVITRDASRTLAVTLESLRAFPDVVIYDNGSADDDDTLEIAQSFPNARIVSGEFIGFGATKNKAAELAAGDWILSIDADESISSELLSSLAEADLSETRQTYAVHQHNYLVGRDIRWGGWGNDWLVRLYNRKHAGLSQAIVHDNIIVPSDVEPKRIAGALLHDNISDIDQLLGKISYYTELRRQESGARVYSPPVTMLRTFWAFFRSYFLQLGFLAGWRGVVIATCDSMGTFFNHMKRYSDERGKQEWRMRAFLPRERARSIQC